MSEFLFSSQKFNLEHPLNLDVPLVKSDQTQELNNS